MRPRLLVLLALALIAVPMASSASAAPKKTCVLKKKASCKKANLRKQKIGKVNLAGADLRSANLAGATLTGTNLTGADLRGANLTGTTFVGVDLRGAKLQSVVAKDATFRRVQFGEGAATKQARVVNFPIAEITGSVCHITLRTIVPVVDLARPDDPCTGSDWTGATIDDVIFVDSSLVGVSFARAHVTHTLFVAGSLDRSSFQQATLEDVSFGATSEKYVNFEGAKCSECKALEGLKYPNVVSATGFAAIPAANNARGANGVTTFSFNDARVSASSYSETGTWGFSRFCGATCSSSAVPIGVTIAFAVTRATAEGSLSATGGLTCSNPGATPVCKGTVSGPVTVTFTPTMRTITVNVDPMMGPTTLDLITISTVSGGTATEVKRCTSASTCSTTVVDGATIRLGASDAAHTVMAQCPGSTEWTPGSSIVSPPSVLTCPDYTATADVTATFEAS